MPRDWRGAARLRRRDCRFAVDVWVPVISFSPRNYLGNRGGQFTQSIARLKSGSTLPRRRLYQGVRQAEWNTYPELVERP